MDFSWLVNKEDRLEALKKVANMRFEVSYKPAKERMKIKRQKFDKHKHKKLELSGNCGVCGAPAQVRHHIIQIQNGGTNGPQNLILLCHTCHFEIHPWMKLSRHSNGLTGITPSASR